MLDMVQFRKRKDIYHLFKLGPTQWGFFGPLPVRNRIASKQVKTESIPKDAALDG